MEADRWARSGLAGRPLVVASRSCHSLWLEQWEGPAERTVRITSAPPVKGAAGAAGKCLVGQQPSEPGGALDERGAHWASTIIFPRSALLKARTTTGLKPRTYGSQAGVRLWQDQTIGEKIVQFPTETTETLNGSSARWAYLFRAPFSWREQNNRERKDPADLPRARGRALFKREWGVNRKASVFVLGFWAPLDLIRSWEGGRSLNQWTLMNHHWWTLHMTRSIRLKAWRHSRT